jgi:NADPH2:quinone reductase
MPPTSNPPVSGLQLRSKVSADAQLEISLVEVETPAPGTDEVLVRIDAAPINPSDLGLLFGMADMAAARKTGTGTNAVVTAPIPAPVMRMLQARVGESMPVGNEGAGEVIAAGESPAAQALIGKTVCLVGGATYAQHRLAPAAMVLPLPEGTTAKDGASWFVNPMTALGMVETMRLEGHSALVHTAAASNLGQMLNRLCQADDIPLVNIVRRQEQVDLLRGIGAKYVCNSSDDDFREQLTDALTETDATLAFDATGGGRLAGQILSCMETAQSQKAGAYSRYGSETHKQVYLYGRLDRSPTELGSDVGMAWGVGGWLLTHFLQKAGLETTVRLRSRVAAEIKTTFASHYTAEISLEEVLDLEKIAAYGAQATGEKFLIKPNG